MKNQFKKECVVDDATFDASDPLPRYKLTRRATIEFKETKGEMCFLHRRDCGCVKREIQPRRHIKHTMIQVTTLEDFYPRRFKSYSQFLCQNDECTGTVEKHDAMFNDLDGIMFDDSPFNGRVNDFYFKCACAIIVACIAISNF